MTQVECIHETLKHINRVGQLLQQIMGKIGESILTHDKSKIEEPELSIFVEYTPKLKASTYGSDEYKEMLKGMGVALDHHYDNNPHHPEYHFRKNNSGFTGMIGLHDMNLIEIIEMLCDWRAATERHANGDIRKSIEINQKRYGYSDELKSMLLTTVNYMGW